MKTTLVELLPELVEILVFGLGSAELIVVGGYIEQFALITVQGGQLKLGVVFGLIGVVAFYFAYLLSTDELRPRVTTLRDRLNELNSI